MTRSLTIEDARTEEVIKEQLTVGGIQLLVINPCIDVIVQGITFATYSALLWDESSDTYDAWIVSGGDPNNFFSMVYNRDNYPQLTEAVAAHVGQLILSEKISIIDE